MQMAQVNRPPPPPMAVTGFEGLDLNMHDLLQSSGKSLDQLIYDFPNLEEEFRYSCHPYGMSKDDTMKSLANAFSSYGIALPLFKRMDQLMELYDMDADGRLSTEEWAVMARGLF